jgi:DNA-binding IclR family transcriptional regulator
MISGSEGIVLERVIGRALIKFYVERGTRFPLHTSAPGKVMLAFMPEAERDAVIAGMKFERFQPWTISNRKDFLKCLDVVRTRAGPSMPASIWKATTASVRQSSTPRATPLPACGSPVPASVSARSA